MKWFAIKTRTNTELKARDFFSSFNIESYAPYYKSRRVWSNRVKKLMSQRYLDMFFLE